MHTRSLLLKVHTYPHIFPDRCGTQRDSAPCSTPRWSGAVKLLQIGQAPLWSLPEERVSDMEIDQQEMLQGGLPPRGGKSLVPGMP